MRTILVIWLIIAGLRLPQPCQAAADLFVLNNGGRIEGVLLNADESPRSSYQVQTRFGGRLTLGEDQVDRVVVKSEAEQRYEEFVKRVRQAEGHWDAARRCEQAKLPAQREFHLEQVFCHDPAHEGAAALWDTASGRTLDSPR